MDNAPKLTDPGHYSYQQVCQAVTVVFVHENGTVNVAGYNHTGDGIRREDVSVGHSEGDTAEFHLPGDCPWGR